ncbi:hypothetical protein [Roseovarius pacificus]
MLINILRWLFAPAKKTRRSSASEDQWLIWALLVFVILVMIG